MSILPNVSCLSCNIYHCLNVIGITIADGGSHWTFLLHSRPLQDLPKEKVLHFWMITWLSFANKSTTVPTLSCNTEQIQKHVVHNTIIKSVIKLFLAYAQTHLIRSRVTSCSFNSELVQDQIFILTPAYMLVWSQELNKPLLDLWKTAIKLGTLCVHVMNCLWLKKKKI